MPIRGESAQPVEEDQVAARQCGGRRGFGTAGPGRRKARDRHFHGATPVDLFRQRSPAVADDGASDRLEQNAIFVRYLLLRPDEDSARPISSTQNLSHRRAKAGIRLDAYQLEPLRKALLLTRVNLFIADDVGLGKTIEAGLIARELRCEHRGGPADSQGTNAGSPQRIEPGEVY